MESNSSKDEENPSKKQLKIMCDVIDQGQNTNPSVTLADDVVKYIISFLPIKEASQTSILAKRFEKSWQHSKHLCFDFLLSRKYYQFQPVNIVHRVIMHHCSKKIETFKLCLNSNNIEYLINLWLVTVLHKEPKEVDLDFLMGKPYASPLQIPFEILDIKSIQTLRISYCVVNLPSKFKGLHFLHSLILRHIKLKRSFIKTIIDNCSLLEHLEIVQCHGIRQIKVDASALKFFKVLKILDCYQLGSVFVDARTMSNFHIDGNPRHVTFGEKIMFELRDVMLNCGRASLALNVPKLKKLMMDIAHVIVLTITSTLIEDLCAAFEIGKMKELKHGLCHVKELQVLMKATSICNPYDIIDFVDRCPILERLFIDMQSFSFQQTNQYLIMKEGFKFELHDKQLSFLKLVKFSNFNFSDSEIQLLKFFLTKVPNLENIAIFTSKKYCLKQYPFAVAEFLEFANSLRSTPTIKVGLYEYNDKEDGVIAPKHRPFSEHYPY